MLELAILGLLKERTMHGYQLSKRLTGTLGGFWRVSYGSLYPTLRRLERDGALERVFHGEEVGRRKNVYRITEKGEKLFFELLEDAGSHESGEENRFRVRLAFFRYLAPEARIRLLERRRAFLQERLTTLARSLRATGESGDSYTLALMQHGEESTRQDITWLDDLIQAERRLSETNARTRGDAKRRRTTRARTSRAKRATRSKRTSRGKSATLQGKERAT